MLTVMPKPITSSASMNSRKYPPPSSARFVTGDELGRGNPVVFARDVENPVVRNDLPQDQAGGHPQPAFPARVPVRPAFPDVVQPVRCAERLECRDDDLFAL